MLYKITILSSTLIGDILSKIIEFVFAALLGEVTSIFLGIFQNFCQASFDKKLPHDLEIETDFKIIFFS